MFIYAYPRMRCKSQEYKRGSVRILHTRGRGLNVDVQFQTPMFSRETFSFLEGVFNKFS